MAILFGILTSTLLAWGYALISPETAGRIGIYLPDGVFKFESIAQIAGKLDFTHFFTIEGESKLIVVIFTFLFVDFFHTVGTLVGVTSRANMLEENGNVPNAGRALLVDAVSTTLGAVLGVSIVTTYVVSSTGVAVGGRTGYTAISTGILFLIAMFFSPIFIAILSCATAPALIYVGYLILGAINNIEFDNITESVLDFLTMHRSSSFNKNCFD